MLFKSCRWIYKDSNDKKLFQDLYLNLDQLFDITQHRAKLILTVAKTLNWVVDKGPLGDRGQLQFDSEIKYIVV